MHTRATLLALLGVGCASSPAPSPEPAAPSTPTYTIQLHRPAVIGELRKRTTTMASMQSLVVTAGETVLQQQNEEVQITFVATEKVVDIDDRGTPTRSEYVVEEAFAESQAGRKELLAANVVLTVTRGIESPFAVEGGSLSPEIEKILGMLFSTSTPTRTDDDIFGSDVAQAVGATWPMHTELAAQDLTEAGLAMDGTALEGETELTAVKTVGTIECLEISARMVATPVAPPGTPAGATIEKARVEATFAGIFPTDASKRRLSDSSEMSAEFTVLQTVDGHPVRTAISMKRSRRSSYADNPPGS